MTNELIVKKTIKINADKSQVWDALVNPEKIKLYLFGTEVISEWKVGSSIIFQGEWEGQSYQDKGTILEFTPCENFQYDYWSSFSSFEDKPENYTRIKFQLAGDEGETILSLTQYNFVTETQRDHSDKNWDSILNHIKELIEKDFPKD